MEIQGYIDMKALPDLELKNFATTPGPRQHLAFHELARRIRNNLSSPQNGHGQGILSTALAHSMPAKRNGCSLSGLSN